MLSVVALLAPWAASSPASAAPSPGAIPAGGVLTVPVGGRAGVPADAVAAVLNVTVANPAAGGFLTVWPCGEDRPLASNLNYAADQSVPNLVLAKLGSAGSVCIFAQQTADVIVDVAGYFPAGSGYTPITNPTRVLDTRDGTGAAQAKVPAGGTLQLTVGGVAGVPADALAAVLNVTVTNPGAGGFLTVWPCGEPVPLASNLNFAAGQTVPNLVIAKLGASGGVCIFAQQTADVIADVAGYFPAGSGYTPITNPTRVLDTRDGTGAALGKLAAEGTLELAVGGVAGVPADALATVLNVTVADPAAAGFLTVWPCGADRPLASNLNYVTRQTVPNLVIAKLGTGGRVCIFSQTATDVVADVGGYFPAGSGYVPIANPTRLVDTREEAAGIPPAAGPAGHLIAKGFSDLSIIDVTTGDAVQLPATSSNIQYGIGSSRNGYFTDVWNYTGGSSWTMTIHRTDGSVFRTYTISGLLASPRSSGALNADATQVAYSVNEEASPTDSTRVDRTYVYDLTTNAPLARIEGFEEPTFADNGELFVNRDGEIHVFDSQFNDQGALPITTSLRPGAYSASPDGRYVVYENGSRIDAYDRATNTGWHVTDLHPRSVYAPVFSPDGRWLALQRAGVLALRYPHIIPFDVGVSHTMDDTTEIRGPGGESYPVGERMGWSA